MKFSKGLSLFFVIFTANQVFAQDGGPQVIHEPSNQFAYERLLSNKFAVPGTPPNYFWKYANYQSSINLTDTRETYIELMLDVPNISNSGPANPKARVTQDGTIQVISQYWTYTQIEGDTSERFSDKFNTGLPFMANVVPSDDGTKLAYVGSIAEEREETFCTNEAPVGSPECNEINVINQFILSRGIYNKTNNRLVNLSISDLDAQAEVVDVSNAGDIAYRTDRSTTGPDDLFDYNLTELHYRSANGTSQIVKSFDRLNPTSPKFFENFFINNLGALFYSYWASATENGLFVFHPGPPEVDRNIAPAISLGLELGQVNDVPMDANDLGTVAYFDLMNGKIKGTDGTVLIDLAPRFARQHPSAPWAAMFRLNNQNKIVFQAVPEHLRSRCTFGIIPQLYDQFPLSGCAGIYSGPDPILNKIIEPGDVLNARVVSGVQLHDFNNNGDILFSVTYGSPLASFEQELILAKGSARGCRVSDRRNVPFRSQVNPDWAGDRYGISTLSSNPNSTMRMFGCSVAALSMVFESYGIGRTPLGSPTNPSTALPFIPLPGLDGGPLNPGSLNKSMASYRDRFVTPAGASTGFSINNDPDWIGAQTIARQGYRAQCTAQPGLCDPNNANSAVSFKELRTNFGIPEQQKVEEEICAGNPVILKFRKASGGQHFMLATGFTLNADGTKEWILNNPGVSEGADVRYDAILQQQYPEIMGYVRYHPSADPAMMRIVTPLSLHFVVTDPQGRRAGFDPSTGVAYNEIPGAAYGEQSIDTPNEIGFSPETLVAQRIFYSPQDVPSGEYHVRAFGEGSGEYYVDYRAYDASGTPNASNYKAGNIRAGDAMDLVYQHTIEPAPRASGELVLKEYRLQKSAKKGLADVDVEVEGQIKPYLVNSMDLDSAFIFEIGNVSGFKISVPANKFKKDKGRRLTEYTYNKNGVKIELSSNGTVKVNLDGANLSVIDDSEMGYIRITVDDIVADAGVEVVCDRKNKKCGLDDERHDGPGRPRHKCKHKGNHHWEHGDNHGHWWHKERHWKPKHSYQHGRHDRADGNRGKGR